MSRGPPGSFSYGRGAGEIIFALTSSSPCVDTRIHSDFCVLCVFFCFCYYNNFCVGQLEEIDKEGGGLSTRHCRGPAAPAGQELGSHILSQILCDQLVLRALNNHLQNENVLHNDNSKDL